MNPPDAVFEGVRFHPDVGPTAAHVVRALRARLVPTLSVGAASAHVDYVSAQAYATTLVALRSAEEAGGPGDAALLAAARRLRGTTFFGRFLGTDGRQDAHAVLVVQWQAGMKRVVWPPGQAEALLVA